MAAAAHAPLQQYYEYLYAQGGHRLSIAITKRLHRKKAIAPEKQA